MAYLFEFDSTNRALRIRFSGVVTDDDLLSYYRMAALTVEALDPLSAITDLSGVTSFQGTAEMIRTVANFPPAMPMSGRPRVIIGIQNPQFKAVEDRLESPRAASRR